MMLMEAAAKLDTGVMERLREVCEEKGIRLKNEDMVPFGCHIYFCANIKTLYIDYINVSTEDIEATIERL